MKVLKLILISLTVLALTSSVAWSDPPDYDKCADCSISDTCEPPGDEALANCQNAIMLNGTAFCFPNGQGWKNLVSALCVIKGQLETCCEGGISAEVECEGLAELEAEYRKCKALANTSYTVALSTDRQTEASHQYAAAMKLCNEILVRINALKIECGIIVIVKPPAEPQEPADVVVEPMEPAIPAPSEEKEVKPPRKWFW